MKSYMRISKLTYKNGTEKFIVEEVREHAWGNSIHPVMNPEYSTTGSRFVPVTMERQNVEDALK